jgi:hypothetical protein
MQELRPPHHVDIDQPPGEALIAVAEAAEIWGAAWEPRGAGGSLLLPVVRGLWRGVESCRVSVAASGGGSRLELAIEDSHHEVNRAAFAILFFGGAGGLAVALWPFFPALLPLLPVAGFLAVVAWLLVAGRLRHTDPDDFLQLVVDLAAAPLEDREGESQQEGEDR